MKIYHNSSCSKSRATLELIKAHAGEQNEGIEVVEYLKKPPTLAELRDLLQKLALPAKSIVRNKEALFIEKYSQLNLDDEAAVLNALVKEPSLMERPIVIRGERAVIGRPPENVEKLWQ